MGKTRKQAFWVVVIHHERWVKDGIEDINSKILEGPKLVLANSASQAETIAARMIPEGMLEFIDDIEVLVTPF